MHKVKGEGWTKKTKILHKNAACKKPTLNIKKEKGWKKICHDNVNQRKVGVVILILDKVDIREKNIKNMTKDKKKVS